MKAYCRYHGNELYAGANAARNVIEVQQPSAVAGRTGLSVQHCPNYNQRYAFSETMLTLVGVRVVLLIVDATR
ncbi:MAG: hypothetical protein ACTSVD_03985 [Candidatus Thorarchaeota archaeon]